MKEQMYEYVVRWIGGDFRPIDEIQNECGNLKNAAKKLKDLQNKLLQSRIEALTNAAEEIIHFEAEIFFKDMGVDILREFDETGTNKELLDVLELGIDTFDEAKAAFDLTMCVGTYMFGTKDTYRGIQEIFYLDEITSCVLAECNKVSVSKNGIKNYNKMLEKCDYYKWLVTISSYGESCNYNMMTSKKNVLTFIRNYFDKKLGNKTPDEWYKEQIKWLNVYNKKLDEIKSINIYEIDETNREESTESENNQEDIKNEIIGTWVGAEDINDLSNLDELRNDLVFATDGSYSMFHKGVAEYTGTYTIENNKVVLKNHKKSWVQGDSENYEKTITYEYQDGILISADHGQSFGFTYYAKAGDNSVEDVIDTSNEMDTNYEEMYESVLSMYRRVIANNYNGDSYVEANEGTDADVNTELLVASRNNDDFAVYYAFIDINGNDVPELVIGAGTPDNIRKYDIFTLDNRSPRRFLGNDDRVIDFGYRINFYLEENGIISIYGSGSATSGEFDFYKISLDGSADEQIESLSHEGETYYNIQGKSISKKEHDSILSKYTGSSDWNLSDKFDLQWQRIE